MLTIDQKKKDTARFDGVRQQILERDGYACVNCGMTQEEHIAKWRRGLTINHINGIGRFAKNPDNRPENLETLCLSCHGKKDGLRTTGNQHGKFVVE